MRRMIGYSIWLQKGNKTIEVGGDEGVTSELGGGTAAMLTTSFELMRLIVSE